MKKLIALRFLIFFLISFIFLISTQSTYAQTLFLDEFNGSGELHLYNNSYELLSDFHPDTGTMDVFNDHVETTGYDPGYIYTAIPGDNVCVSIDFNWTGGNPTGHWTNILLHSTTNSFGVAFQVRNDDATHQRWVFYNSGNEGQIYKAGSVSFDEAQTHTLKACVSGSTVTGYLDEAHLFTGEDTLYSGNFVGFASQSPTHYLDNFRIETLQIIPSPSPTPDLNVPVLMQTDKPWDSQIYDRANFWSPFPKR